MGYNLFRLQNLSLSLSLYLFLFLSLEILMVTTAPKVEAPRVEKPHITEDFTTARRAVQKDQRGDTIHLLDHNHVIPVLTVYQDLVTECNSSSVVLCLPHLLLFHLPLFHHVIAILAAT